MPVDDKAIIDFLQKSYFSVDGLWFLGVEEKYSQDAAILIDEKVWGIMPKIQTKKAREILGLEGYSLENLASALTLKLESEGYEYEVSRETPGKLIVRINTCPWLEILKKADRTAFAVEICDRVCAQDLGIWAAQLAKNVEFRMNCNIPSGAPSCEMTYTQED
jgi:hypothetical protein